MDLLVHVVRVSIVVALDEERVVVVYVVGVVSVVDVVVNVV